MNAVPAPAPAPAPWSQALRVTQARVILSEWTKLRSIRSTRWSMLVAVVLTIGFPCLAAAITAAHWSHMSPLEQANRHPLDIAIVGARFAQLAIGVLGVLVITGEYSTGMIRASLGAVPKRLPFLWAKLVVFASVTFVLMDGCTLPGMKKAMPLPALPSVYAPDPRYDQYVAPLMLPLPDAPASVSVPDASKSSLSLGSFVTFW